MSPYSPVMMKQLSLVVVVVASFAGCGKSGNSAMLDKMDGFATAACACKDAACTTKVMEDMGKWAESQKASMGDKQPSADEAKRVAEISKKFQDCIMKAAKP